MFIAYCLQDITLKQRLRSVAPGASYYLNSRGGRTGHRKPAVGVIQFGLLMFGDFPAVVGYLFGIHEGRAYLEQPTWIKLAIVVVALIFLY